MDLNDQWAAERCKAPKCSGRRNCVGFLVSDSTWAAVVGDPDTIWCLECFDEKAQELGVHYVIRAVHAITWSWSNEP